MKSPMNIGELTRALEQGRTFDYRVLEGNDSVCGPAPSCFGQWFPCHFEVDGRTYTSSGQFMLAGVARLFRDRDAALRIMSTQCRDQMASAARAVRGFNRGRWENARFDIMTIGLAHKFDQDPTLCGRLLATGNRVLAEANEGDRDWAIGLDGKDPAAFDPQRWPGKNLFGFALMRVRSILRGELNSPAFGVS